MLGGFASGVTVIAALNDDVPVGMTCQSFSSVSLDPPLVLFVPSSTSRTWPLIRSVGCFGVSILADGQQTLANRFAAPATDKFAGVDWTPSGRTGSPLIAGAVAWLDCVVEAVHPGGDHDIVVGRVVDLVVGPAEQPLVFYRGSYHSTDLTTQGELDDSEARP